MRREKKHSYKNQKKKKTVSPESKEKIIARVKELTEPLCESEGMELVHVEYQRESAGRILRIYIDRPGGIRIDDCKVISRQLSDLLDVCIEIDEAFSLEVTSPGLDRPLSKKEDFERFKGNIAKIRIKTPVNGQKNFKGVLIGISDEIVILKSNDKIISINFQDINNARLVMDNPL